MLRCEKCGASYEGEHACRVSARHVETLVTRERPARFDDARFTRSMAYMPASVIGSYRVQTLLGDGAIGRVYLAEHIKLGKKVALKMLRSEYAKHPAVVKRFFAEARAVSKIEHENIVRITDFFEDEEGKSYYIMEHLDGETLRAATKGGPLPFARVLSIARQIASALQAAHDQRIVHRDLKPENVFLVPKNDGTDLVKLLDFGVAKLLDAREAKINADTATGTLVGSPPYMAPEQTYGLEVDHRADIYAFGVVLYELLTGKNPFESGTIGEIIELQRNLVPPPPVFGDDVKAPQRRVLEPLLIALLQKSPEARPPRMRDVLATLSSIDLSPRRPADRRALVALGAGFGLVLAAAGIGYAMIVPSQEPVVIATVEREVRAPVQPAPAVEDQEPKRVRLDFDSEPRGAEVRRADSDEPLGVTPFFVELLASAEPIEVELSKDGYETAKRSVTPDRNVGLVLQLEKKKVAEPRRVRAKARRAVKGTSGPIDPSEQKNPFGEK